MGAPKTETQPEVVQNGDAQRDETPLTLPIWQAQEIMNFLGNCPAGQSAPGGTVTVWHMIGFLATAQSKEQT